MPWHGVRLATFHLAPDSQFQDRTAAGSTAVPASLMPELSHPRGASVTIALVVSAAPRRHLSLGMCRKRVQSFLRASSTRRVGQNSSAVSEAR